MASQKEKFSVLRFLNSKNENVASIVTPFRDETKKREDKRTEKLDNSLRPEDKVIVKPSNAKFPRLNGNGAARCGITLLTWFC